MKGIWSFLVFWITSDFSNFGSPVEVEDKFWIVDCGFEGLEFTDGGLLVANCGLKLLNDGLSAPSRSGKFNRLVSLCPHWFMLAA